MQAVNLDASTSGYLVKRVDPEISIPNNTVPVGTFEARLNPWYKVRELGDFGYTKVEYIPINEFTSGTMNFPDYELNHEDRRLGVGSNEWHSINATSSDMFIDLTSTAKRVRAGSRVSITSEKATIPFEEIKPYAVCKEGYNCAVAGMSDGNNDWRTIAQLALKVFVSSDSDSELFMDRNGIVIRFYDKEGKFVGKKSLGGRDVAKPKKGEDGKYWYNLRIRGPLSSSGGEDTDYSNIKIVRGWSFEVITTVKNEGDKDSNLGVDISYYYDRYKKITTEINFSLNNDQMMILDVDHLAYDHPKRDESCCRAIAYDYDEVNYSTCMAHKEDLINQCDPSKEKLVPLCEYEEGAVSVNDILVHDTRENVAYCSLGSPLPNVDKALIPEGRKICENDETKSQWHLVKNTGVKSVGNLSEGASCEMLKVGEPILKTCDQSQYYNPDNTQMPELSSCLSNTDEAKGLPFESIEAGALLTSEYVEHEAEFFEDRPSVGNPDYHFMVEISGKGVQSFKTKDGGHLAPRLKDLEITNLSHTIGNNEPLPKFTQMTKALEDALEYKVNSEATFPINNVFPFNVEQAPMIYSKQKALFVGGMCNKDVVQQSNCSPSEVRTLEEELRKYAANEVAEASNSEVIFNYSAKELKPYFTYSKNEAMSLSSCTQFNYHRCEPYESEPWLIVEMGKKHTGEQPADCVGDNKLYDRCYSRLTRFQDKKLPIDFDHIRETAPEVGRRQFEKSMPQAKYEHLGQCTRTDPNCMYFDFVFEHPKVHLTTTYNVPLLAPDLYYIDLSYIPVSGQVTDIMQAWAIIGDLEKQS